MSQCHKSFSTYDAMKIRFVRASSLGQVKKKLKFFFTANRKEEFVRLFLDFLSLCIDIS